MYVPLGAALPPPERGATPDSARTSTSIASSQLGDDIADVSALERVMEQTRTQVFGERIPSEGAATETTALQRTTTMDGRGVMRDGRHCKGAMYHQGEVAATLSMPTKMTGMCLGTLCIIMTWESTEFAADWLAHEVHRDPRKIMIFIHIGMAIVGWVCMLAGSTALKLAMRRSCGVITWYTCFAAATTTLVTIVTCVGVWGAASDVVDFMFPDHPRLSRLIGGVFFLCASMIYTTCTKHMVLLDIASCVTSLGIYDDHFQHKKELDIHSQHYV